MATHTASSGREAAIKTLGEKIQGIRIAMLTTVETNSELRSRPMAAQDMEFDGELWFFTKADSPKVDEVQRDQQVNLAYANPDKNIYVSISGRAQLVRDQSKMRDLWKPFLKAWFPNGLEDPELALLRVQVTGAEYWDEPNKAVQLTQIAASALTGHQADSMGDNQKLNLH